MMGASQDEQAGKNPKDPSVIETSEPEFDDRSGEDLTLNV
jgi:hypothetical protein